MAISRQKDARSRNYALLLFRMISRVFYSAQYHRLHYTLQAFEHFGTLYMHNHDDRYLPARDSNLTNPSRYEWAIRAGLLGGDASQSPPCWKSRVKRISQSTAQIFTAWACPRVDRQVPLLVKDSVFTQSSSEILQCGVCPHPLRFPRGPATDQMNQSPRHPPPGVYLSPLPANKPYDR